MMNVPLWVAELAAAFWADAKGEEPFPRNLRQPIARAAKLTVVSLSKPSISSVLSWLRKNGIVCELGSRDRSLRACLVARHGFGIVFIDGSDQDAEQRFSIAHELAHFLRDYWHPRRLVSKRLGPAALDVLDGNRVPTAQERVHALLRNTCFGFHAHFMDREAEGNPATSALCDAEQSADRLAYELLAPAKLALSSALSFTRENNHQALEVTLREVYGLPIRQAAHYAELLLPARSSDPFLLQLKEFL